MFQLKATYKATAFSTTVRTIITISTDPKPDSGKQEEKKYRTHIKYVQG